MDGRRFDYRGPNEVLEYPDSPVKDGYGESEVHLIADNAASAGDCNEKRARYFHDAQSEAGASIYHHRGMYQNLQTKEQTPDQGPHGKMEEIETIKVTGSRKRWLWFVWMLTFWMPNSLISTVGGMKRKEIRTAWREKLAINIMIWFSCLFVCFFIVVFPELLCPKQNIFSPEELSSYNGKGSNGAYMSIRGMVFDLGAFAPTHYPSVVPTKQILKYAGLDVTDLFPIQVSALCQGINGDIDPTTLLDYKPTNISGGANVISLVDQSAKYHDFRYYTGDYRPDWVYEKIQDMRKNFMVGRLGFSPEYLTSLAANQESIASINGRVYDMTKYLQQGRSVAAPKGQNGSASAAAVFMATEVEDLFQQRSGQDVTDQWTKLSLSSAAEKKNMKLCLDNLFYVGDVDTRNSLRCQFARYILLAVSILLVSVIGFKFFAALQFSRKNSPENIDKFVICQIPAYTEDEESLRRAIDSVARMKYDDKRKLLVVICDGMVVGQGNDRPTPQIVLDILGVSPKVDPEPLSFESLGEGQRQHNMGKVYSGLYEIQGHIVPFLVIVKVGKPSETLKAGNRGKRDSQMLLMRFLMRIHYNAPLNPLELEMHHHIRNIIGVNPTFYEFLLQVDADTSVGSDSATRFVSAFLNDTRLLGICGETALTNAKASFITMIQVYEYYISHNLSKAFESLFSSVTCLPGCFSMYRIRSANTGKPLFVSREICEAYSTIRVDTLHMKNLLHLGEDRFLTTLLLKHHPKYKTKYTMHAHAWTIAPEGWKVFLSQRRRWINSTVHNLSELLPMSQLCGFCCFSMRFIVFLDLLSTIIQPVTVAYIGYLIVLLVRKADVVPLTAFILLGAIYGLQAIIFILRRKWEMIGWMVLYILAIPIFSFALPLYSFWSMDNFSWGSTRVIQGEKGRAIVVSDEGKFDPDSIPKKKWEDYQAELWEAQTMTHDDRSEMSGYTYGRPTYSRAGSAMMGRSTSQLNLAIEDRMHPGSARMSRISLAPTETAFLPSQRYSTIVGTFEGDEMWELRNNRAPSSVISDGETRVTDDAILAEIKDILATADLMTVTKKSVRLELERRFGVSMANRKSYIGYATEAVLAGQM